MSDNQEGDNMAKRETVSELKEKIAYLQPFQEAFFCLAHHCEQIEVESGENRVVVTGLERASGGVVIMVNSNNSVHFVCDICSHWAFGENPYFREIASKIRRMQKEAIEKRCA